jgi:hypothetical protein
MAGQTDMRARRETIQRIQVGLVGLAIVLLIVASTNIVVRTLRPDAMLAGPGATNAQLAAGAPNGTAPTQATDGEPLADLGVTPKAETAVPAATAGPVGPSVPDLEPDPRLSKPMDRDPRKPQPSAAGRN